MKNILFLPSNKNHVIMFEPINKVLLKKYNTIFLSQGSFKNEGVEEALNDYGIYFDSFDSVDNPISFLLSKNIHLVILGNDSDVIPQWFVNSAKELEISTILIQDGLMFDIQRSFDQKIKNLKQDYTKKLLRLRIKLGITKKFKKISYGMANCSAIFTWSESAESYFVNKGVKPQKLKRIGYPKMIHLENHNLAENKTILYSPTALHELGFLSYKEKYLILDTLVKTVLEIPNCKLIIKPHPIENISLYEKIVQKYPHSVQISNSSFFDLIKHADIVVSDVSTTILESLARNVPVIIFLPNIQDKIKSKGFPFDLIDTSPVAFADNANSLKHSIQTLLANPSMQLENLSELVDHYLGLRDNLFAQRAFDHITKLITDS